MAGSASAWHEACFPNSSCKKAECVKKNLSSSPTAALQHSPRHTAVFVVQGWIQGREKGEGKEERKREEGDRERGERGDGKKSQRGADERNMQQEESSAGQSEAGLRQSHLFQRGD